MALCTYLKTRVISCLWLKINLSKLRRNRWPKLKFWQSFDQLVHLLPLFWVQHCCLYCLHAEVFWGNIKTYLEFLVFLDTIDGAGTWKFFMTENNSFILQSQYHGWGWCANTTSLRTSIDIVPRESIMSACAERSSHEWVCIQEITSDSKWFLWNTNSQLSVEEILTFYTVLQGCCSLRKSNWNMLLRVFLFMIVQHWFK